MVHEMVESARMVTQDKDKKLEGEGKIPIHAEKKEECRCFFSKN